MNDIIVPGWVAFLIIPGVISWMVWITLNTFANKSDIRINNENDIAFRNEIRQDILEIKQNFQSLSNTILNLFGQEISLLKQNLGIK
jgi:hypothetical protein